MFEEKQRYLRSLIFYMSVCKLQLQLRILCSEKRAKFDNGEDPLDPEQQAGGGGGGGPFYHPGFNPFGQGGFQFKFHFN
jgi:hypothetical protein